MKESLWLDRSPFIYFLIALPKKANETTGEARHFGTEIVGGNQDVDNVKSQTETSHTTPFQSDASVSPGVLEFIEKLLRDQLAPELYTLVQRLHRKASWIDPDVGVSASALVKFAGPLSPDQLRDSLARRAQVVSAYLAEKPLRTNLDAVDTLDRSLDTDFVLPLLPPPASTDTLVFTPLLDFIKSLCEVRVHPRSFYNMVHAQV